MSLGVDRRRVRTRGQLALCEYLERVRASDLCVSAGITPQLMSHLRHGRRKASFEVAFALEDATGGFVRARWWTERLDS